MTKQLLKMMLGAAGVAILAIGAAGVAGAQATTQLGQLDGRASASLKAQVVAIADSMTQAGLPVAPLVDKTLEGISKGAADQRIMVAVRGVANDLGVARRALGPSSDAELTAAVAALRGGSSPAGLTQLRRELPGRTLVVPLSVLASLLVDGAPSTSAIVAVVTTAKQSNDMGLLAYGRDVSRNIASGVAPLMAISAARTGAFSSPAPNSPTIGKAGGTIPIRSSPGKPRP
jgi:hypothetical protein